MEDDALLRCLREHRALFTGGCRAKVMSIERMATPNPYPNPNPNPR